MQQQQTNLSKRRRRAIFVEHLAVEHGISVIARVWIISLGGSSSTVARNLFTFSRILLLLPAWLAVILGHCARGPIVAIKFRLIKTKQKTRQQLNLFLLLKTADLVCNSDYVFVLFFLNKNF